MAQKSPLRVFVALFLMSVVFMTFHGQSAAANPETITVPENYSSIQDAINHARPGDTVYVKAGIYFEHIVIERNSLKLVGENEYTTIIDGGGTGIVVYVHANSTIFEGFTVRNSGYNLTDSGIYLYHSFNTFLSSNNVINNNLGISLFSSSHSVLRTNNMTGNRYNFGVNGINLQDYLQDIDTSNIADGKPVIYWVNQTNKQPPANAGYVAVVNSTNVTLQDLTLTKNWQAVLFAYCTNSAVKNVTASNNMDCIWLLDCVDCSVAGSTVSDNNWGGIAFVNSSGCSVYGNNVTNNAEYGLLLSDSSDNMLYHNSFINNGGQVWLYGFSNNTLDNGYPSGGNFWSDYGGVDEKSGPHQSQPGSDGVGDTPYVIDSNNKDRYPLMKPWSLPSPKTPAVEVAAYFIAEVAAILMVFGAIIYSIRIRKQRSSNSKRTTSTNHATPAYPFLRQERGT
jgi:parallel beta-helix repeat protein